MTETVDQSKSWKAILTVGFALFGMFFGSGNIIFPIVVGYESGPFLIPAFAGLILTAVFLPLFGYIAVSLYNGQYLAFFQKLGKLPGWLIFVLIICLIGPFGVIPRCLVISHAAFDKMLLSVPLPLFSILACALIFALTIKRSKILEIIGQWLTPLLLLILAILVVKGVLGPSPQNPTDTHLASGMLAFGHGLIEGYNTMDILAAFIFAGAVLEGISRGMPELNKAPKKMLWLNLKGSLVATICLAAVYGGMAWSAVNYAEQVSTFPKDQALIGLSLSILGDWASVFVAAAVSLACLTTAISLCMSSAEAFGRFTGGRINYPVGLVLTLLLSFAISNLEFSGIQAFIVPILKIVLPSICVLTLVNVLHRVTGFKMIRTPVAVTLAVTLFFYFWK